MIHTLYNTNHEIPGLSTALFFHHLAGPLIMLAPVSLMILSISLTFAIRSITPGSSDLSKKPEIPKPEDVENSAIPDPSSASVEGITETMADGPPPYQPPETSQAAETVVLAKPAVKRSSAHLFVLGTFGIVTVTMSLFLLVCSHTNLLLPKIKYLHPNRRCAFNI